MAVITRRTITPEKLTFKQLAKVILLFKGISPEYKEECCPSFRVRETAIQQLIGQSLSLENRADLVREFNLLGWEVAINPEYWLVFTVPNVHNWHEVGQWLPYSVTENFQRGIAPCSRDLCQKLGISVNEVAKFYGYSEEKIRDELVCEAYDCADEETQEEFDETGDESLFDIEEGTQLPIDTFSYWQYLDFYLATKGLNRKAPLF
ncbi:hypothetical protein [Vibrio rotiferianus]|uniref:hypothetical protein n=1 Tax=Vibrio rotiferianus TaxID=190895 RepID=UPI000694CCAD|nr:hypothetical protein [Vibrio rotiferianus]